MRVLFVVSHHSLHTYRVSDSGESNEPTNRTVSLPSAPPNHRSSCSITRWLIQAWFAIDMLCAHTHFTHTCSAYIQTRGRTIFNGPKRIWPIALWEKLQKVLFCEAGWLVRLLCWFRGRKFNKKLNKEYWSAIWAILFESWKRYELMWKWETSISNWRYVTDI